MAKIGDFGLANNISNHKEMDTKYSVSKFFENYAAPEVMQGEFHRESDVYSFGVLVGIIIRNFPCS